MCQVWWCLEVKRQRTFMTFERFSLKLPCVSRNVSLIFTWSYWVKFIWYVLNSYTSIFGLKSIGKYLEGPPKGPWGRTQSWYKDCPRHPKPRRHALWVTRRLVGRVSSLGPSRGSGGTKDNPQSQTTDQQDGPLVKGRAIDGPSVDSIVPSCSSLLSEGEI